MKQIPDIEELNEISRELRLDVLEMTCRHSAHLSSCFSAVEILVALFFGSVLNYDPTRPHWELRDRFILSKGHAAPLFYAVLARAGYIYRDRLMRFREYEDELHGHPVQDTLPGVELTTGSLGQGLSAGIGHVLAGRLSKKSYKVFVLMGDGECEEGQVWEAAMFAGHHKLNDLIAIIDHNKYQQTGPISRELSLSPLDDKWRSFGWQVEECDGHSLSNLLSAFSRAKETKGKPTVLIAHTTKGKGVSFVEKDYSFHGKGLSMDQSVIAREEIACLSVN